MSDSNLKSNALLKTNSHQKAKLTLIVLTVTVYNHSQNTHENRNEFNLLKQKVRPFKH